MAVSADVIKKSVTAGDYPDHNRGGGVLHFLIPVWQTGAQIQALPLDPPPFWSRQLDFVLRATPYVETSFWAGAIAIAISKMSSLGWEVEGEKGERVKWVQNLMLGAEGPGGWVRFLSKHLRDYLTTCHGPGIELIRGKKAAVSRIIGLKHLDACRLTRTGDPQIPAVYRDRKGREHALKDYQVILFSDMPDPSDTYYGVGQCAALRAYREIFKMAAIQRYVAEKISGSRPLAVHLVTGISEKSLESGMITAAQHQAQKGAVLYQGSVVIPIMGDIPATVVTIPLAEIPDGFDAEREREWALLSYANAIGLSPLDLKPLTGKMGGTATQSRVLDEKGDGRGLAAWRQEFMHAINEYVTPAATRFYFHENDLRDRQARAQISQLQVGVMATAIAGQIITPEQALQVLIDRDEFPKEFMTVDTTANRTMSDIEKPMTELPPGDPRTLDFQPEPAQEPAAGAGGADGSGGSGGMPGLSPAVSQFVQAQAAQAQAGQQGQASQAGQVQAVPSDNAGIEVEQSIGAGGAQTSIETKLPLPGELVAPWKNDFDLGLTPPLSDEDMRGIRPPRTKQLEGIGEDSTEDIEDDESEDEDDQDSE